MSLAPDASTPSTVRVRLDLAYRGTAFSGWASQPELRTVQGELEDALTRLLGHGFEPVRLTVAGRTDAGVHAAGQVAHFDLETAQWTRFSGRESDPGRRLVRKLASMLPADIAVHAARQVPLAFDARFSPLSRSYIYRISDRLKTRDPLRADHVLARPRELDVAAMNLAATPLLGLHDFAAYCRPREGATTIRTLQRFTWSRPDDGPDAGLVVAELQADAFCHSMVRSLVGSALLVGEGKRPPGWMAQVLAGGDRSAAGAVAPAHGLVLAHVEYPPDADLAARAVATRARRQPPAASGEAGCC